MARGKPKRVTATSKEGRKLMAAIQDAGGRVTRTTRGHLLVHGPGGIATISSKLEGSKGITVAVAVLRRIEINVT